MNGEFYKSIAAGVAISIGGSAFLLSESKILGAFLFAIGLFIICELKLNLFTGKICFNPSSEDTFAVWAGRMLLIYFSNFCGVAISTAYIKLSRLYPILSERATEVMTIKQNDSSISLWALGIFCNLLIYFSVSIFGKKDGFECVAAIFMGVMVFVYCGFEHCIADMFYALLAPFSLQSLRVIGMVTLGNICGGFLCWEIKH